MANVHGLDDQQPPGLVEADQDAQAIRKKRKMFHCPIPGCDSRVAGKGFPLKNSWTKHMTKIHNLDVQQLPEPIETDREIGEM